MTDSDLMNALMKEGMTLAESEFNKTLLDLEIYGLVRVSWVTKEKRRNELVADSGTASKLLAKQDWQREVIQRIKRQRDEYHHKVWRGDLVRLPCKFRRRVLG